MDRRHFLKTSGASLTLGSLVGLLPSWAHALTTDAATQGKYLLMISIASGWDVSLSLDPWTESQRPDPTDYFIEYPESDVFKVGAVNYGPALIPLRQYLADFSVIRGIFLSENDNGHAAAAQMMKTGNGSGKNPSLVADVASLSNLSNLGVLSNQPIYLADRKVGIYGLSDLMSYSLSSAAMAGDSGRGALATAVRESISQADKFNQFVKTRSQLMGSAVDPTQLTGATIAAAFQSELTTTSFFEINEDLDTHSNHEKRHLTAQTKAWQQVANIIKNLKATPLAADTAGNSTGESVFDQTTIVIFSEFSRTPALNSSLGKDHNPMMNAALVSGPGFKKGMDLGGSRIIAKKDSVRGVPYHIALPYSLDTNSVITNRDDFVAGIMITPEVLMATLAEGMKISRHMFGCAHASTDSLRALLKG